MRLNTVPGHACTKALQYWLKPGVEASRSLVGYVHEDAVLAQTAVPLLGWWCDDLLPALLFMPSQQP